MAEATDLQAALKVVGGNPTAEELAAVIAVLAQAREEELSHGIRVSQTARSTWSKNSGILRSELTVGNGQWQAAFRTGF